MSDMENVSVSRRVDPAEIEARFHALVQSPLRAGLLRFLCARPDESFEVESLMQTFGRMRLDVENCMRELVTFGVAGKVAGTGTPRYAFQQPQGDTAREDRQRKLWLPYLLHATVDQVKITLGGATNYSVDKAIPGGWEFTEYEVGADKYDAIRVHWTIYVTETVVLTP